MIEIRNLYKSYQDKPVLCGINVTIADGDIYGLVGASGAGKSTLLRCVNGLESFERGTLLVNGTDISQLRGGELRKFRSGIGMIFQQFSLLERKTVYENILFPMKCFHYKKADADARVHELLQLVELTDKTHARPDQLSGGQKQRVAIARALAMNPDILLCDEATSALDPNITKSILALLKKINQELGITIIVVTHQMEVVKQICNNISILSKGELKASGSVQDIFLKRAAALDELLGIRAPDADDNKALIEIVQRPDRTGLLADFALATGIRFEVLWGGLDRYADNIAGTFTVAMDRRDFANAQAYLDAIGAEWRNL
ncbi:MULTISPECIES: ATP-binding cassette domain-containing protein [unclassified Brenneria]|uniref:methionine ABC transporter ATP-binding protein n=1 Tax=unclassified Brenneria TaxID=2634434 RepID=UPI0029C1AD5C|nr:MULTISPECIES: ATP-binding cassette domain-containing protein [unclassified Brenneria]MDX5629369.1 ATP-binding cassette domain-containing protein [Brenneria sp. L3-3Z]MDX5696468.1 ATP-binding cassette domain-containing protein [Brenneria sp. L4-2C]